MARVLQLIDEWQVANHTLNQEWLKFNTFLFSVTISAFVLVENESTKRINPLMDSVLKLACSGNDVKAYHNIQEHYWRMSKQHGCPQKITNWDAEPTSTKCESRWTLIAVVPAETTQLVSNWNTAISSQIKDHVKTWLVWIVYHAVLDFMDFKIKSSQ